MLKDRIITAAVGLFNEVGISKVSMKQIADSLGISPGNLTYHFKTKADLIGSIYEMMHHEAVDYTLPVGYVTLYHFESMMMKYLDFNKKYSFFFIDVVFVTKQFPVVGKMYAASNVRRFKEAKKLIKYFVDSGRMIPEPSHYDYDKLIHSIWMLIAFWSAQAQVIDHNQYSVNKHKPMTFLWQQLLPFLTEKGWKEYLEIKNLDPIMNK